MPKCKKSRFLQSITVRKHHEQKNACELPSTSAYNKSSFESVKPSDNLYDNNFKKQVLRQLQIINLRQQQISEDLSVLLMKANSEKDEPIISNEKSIFKNYNFPLKEIKELEAIEEFLIEDNNFKKFVTEIIKIGGTSYKQMVKRVLTRIISNDLSKTYSWIGYKGKRNFFNLRICSAILSAVQKTHGCSEAMIEAVIKYWLVKSIERQKQLTKEKNS
ncbi:uncharacterized protein LOC112637647 [Camponotus floridanus]|uniref:uncharacterized protein LOC112637647 n=1 Tax=Camponotus floridanus TaxID=104421 RepID=UPI000DC68514|nr:uncharacterized protein LOC112637647 [Camponotus floridanus]